MNYSFFTIFDSRKESFPDVSIIIPFYNRGELTIKSILSTTNQYNNNNISPEIIVIDDGSEEKLEKEKINHLPDLLIARMPINKGANIARNLGLLLSRGKYILFLDSDDELLEDSLILLFNEINNLSVDYAAISGSILIDNLHLNKKTKKQFTSNYCFRQRDIISWNPVGPLSKTIFRKNYLIDINGFNEQLPACQDWELYIRLAKIGKIIATEKIIVKYLVHNNSTTSSLLKGILGRNFIEDNYLNKSSIDSTNFILTNILFFFRRGGFEWVSKYIQSRSKKISIINIIFVPWSLLYLIYSKSKIFKEIV
jgi:glycosyltransferase involved in cell wall biosynthesis